MKPRLPSLASRYDAAQLAAPLAIDQGESSWYCFEGSGRGPRGTRHLAGLVWIHRTGPRASRLALRPSLVKRDALPARWRDLVPAWLPIVSPVDLGLDDRPLFLVAIYDLDERAIRQIELPIDAFDPATFSAATAGGELALRHYAPAEVDLPPELRAFFAGDGHGVSVHARGGDLELELHVRGRKPMLACGDDGTPRIRHGRIEVGYAQRPIDVVGSIALAGEAVTDFRGVGAHDRHWRDSTVLGLRWLWLHLRLAGARELVAYVIRDTRGGATADADAGRELGRRAWLVDAEVQPLDRFELRATAHADTPRGRIPTSFAFEAPALELALAFEHAVPLPFVPMRAFGELADFGFYEGPIRVTSGACEGGWLEIVAPPLTSPGSASGAASDPTCTTPTAGGP